jgi:uncharacterized DUF497 family protein
MQISYDPAKNTRNIRDRGLSFDQVHGFGFEAAVIRLDARFNYGETRYRALGMLDGRLHALVFTEIVDGIRIISFRKANKREMRWYEQETQS